MNKLSAVVSMLLLVLGCNLAGADWPLFRGNALQTGVAKETLAETLEVLWKIQLEDGIDATAAIVKDTVYVGAFDQHLYAFDLATGKQKWKYKAGPFKAPPSVHEGAVYVGDEDGMFHCVDAATGQKRWTFETGGEITGGANFAADKVLVGSHDSTLYCLDRQGKLVWKVKTEGPVNGSALVAGKLTFVAGCDSNLHIIDWGSGKDLAQIDLQGQAAATAAVIGDQLFVGTMTNFVQGVDLTKKALLWSYESKRGQPFFASAAVTEQLVIVGGRDKLVHALDRTKGDPVWTFPTKGRIDSSPVVAGPRLYVGSGDGHLYVLNVKDGQEVQKLQLGRGIMASPAVAHGRLVIGTTDGSLVCLGKKE
jgi:outer membrane protein assembly factor BamB